MIRNSFIIIFALTLLVQTFAGYIVLADYALNKAAYLENCENKKRPQLRCKGKCQLSKKLHEAEGDEQSSGSAKPLKLSEVLSSKVFLPVILCFELPNTELTSLHFSSSLVVRTLASIFRPPQVH